MCSRLQTAGQENADGASDSGRQAGSKCDSPAGPIVGVSAHRIRDRWRTLISDLVPVAVDLIGLEVEEVVPTPKFAVEAGL